MVTGSFTFKWWYGIFINLPMWPSGQCTRALCAVECDALSGQGSNLSPGASPYQNKLFHIIPMHIMNREIIPGRKKGLYSVLYKL